jgi:hypothetical protein
VEEQAWSVQRKEDRTPARGSVMISNDTGFASGLITNISSSGLCAYVQETFDSGETVSVYSKNFTTKGPRVAHIKWCNKLTDDLFKVGLFFNHPE